MLSRKQKKLLHFLQLAFIFGAITIFALLADWGYQSGLEKGMQMMGQSMGSMMQGHAQNVTITDLIRNADSGQISSGSGSVSEHSSHHNQANTYLGLMHYLTTATIVILLPFILAGTIFISITALGRR